MELKSSKEGSFTEGYYWSFGATALPLIGAFVVSLIVARFMGPRAAGLIYWTMALATVLLIVGKFGIYGAASRLASEYTVARPEAIPGLVRSSLLLRFLFTVPTAVAATVLAPRLARFFGEEALVPLFRVGGALIFAVSVNELAALIILGLKRFRLLFAMRLSMLVLRVSLVLAAALLAVGAVGVIWAFIAAAMLPGAVIFGILLRMPSPRPAATHSPIQWGRLVKLSAILAVSGASVTIYSLLDKLMLGYFAGPIQVGLYSMARNVVEVSLFPTFALVMILRPALAGAFAEGDTARCARLVNRSIRNSFFYAACVVVVFSCLARPLIIGLYKESFAVSAELLVLFLPLIVMRSIGAVILPGLIAAERAGTYARLTVIGAICNFTFNAILIPVWGAKGAVLSTLISYLPIDVLGLRALAGAVPGFYRSRDLLVSLKAALAAACIIFLYLRFLPAPGNFLMTIVTAITLTVIYIGVLLLIRVLTFSEIDQILKPILNRPNRR
ncbi:MAG: oligosaccharide flippase family protein [bacterium]|nr:MAG: oligosaccharide flippase family protein [bacterium]